MSKITVGKSYPIAQGGMVTITKKISLNKVEVRHDDEYGYTTVVSTNNLRDGNIKNPYKPNVIDKGFFGSGPYAGSKGKLRYPSYRIWHSLIKRVYVKKPELSLWEDWHDFQVFTRWYLNELEMIEEGSFKLSNYLEDGCYKPPVIVERHLQDFYEGLAKQSNAEPNIHDDIIQDGIEYGYPKCCTESFIKDIKEARIGRRQDRQLTGTGFVPCAVCDVRYSEQELVDLINSKRNKDVEPFAPLKDM